MHLPTGLITRMFLVGLTSLLPLSVRAEEATATRNLAPPEALPNIKPSDPEVTVAAGQKGASFVVTIQPSTAKFPGVKIAPPTGTLDLSAYGYVEAQVTNRNSAPLAVNVRVDNTQHGAYWVQQGTKIAPGETGLVRAYFTAPADGFQAAKVSEILLFTGKVTGTASTFQVDSLVAGGKPGDVGPVNPTDVRVKPDGGIIYAAGTVVEPAQLFGKEGGAMSFQNGELKATILASSSPKAVAIFRPPTGAWNLRDQLEVRVSLKNSGTSAVIPQVRLDSTSGPTDTIASPAPVPPGAEVELVVPFAPLVSWKATSKDLGEKPSSKNKVEGSGNSFISNSALDVGISALPASVDRCLTVTSIKADLPAQPEMPDWVGKRPPGDGDWVQTFDEEFKGTTLDGTKWTSTGDNWYDKISHFSKDNVIVGNGQALIRFEKKTGAHNDDPASYTTDYATGYLDTWDKFVQRYGYFESKMKLPAASGMWPAFWLMPDRPGTAKRGIRGSTSDGGMEFDIMEHLSIWGPYRYNIAMHWDGYEEAHKATGSKIYFQPDKDGYVTSGLLWTPGSAVYYANGKEVLRLETPRTASVPEMIIFTMPCGGWDNNHLDPKDPQLPADLIIKYVRVWQRKDLASDADTVNIAVPQK